MEEIKQSNFCDMFENNFDYIIKTKRDITKGTLLVCLVIKSTLYAKLAPFSLYHLGHRVL